jgi:negative regulator of flagellin synthesis FlgM
VKITNGIDSTGGFERPGTDQAGGARARSTTAPGTSLPASDTIRISDLSNQLAGLESRFAADGSFDAARVEAIKTAMREGRFAVNADAVAEKLLDSVRELLRKPS